MAAARTAETYERAAATRRATIASGKYEIPAGEAHPRWTGGKAEAERRLRASGKKAAGTRKYRAENPHKVREFTLRRSGRKIGRLPRGTVRAQGETQAWRCFVCRADLASGYHVDHWMPLAKGGAHEPGNIRLLCPTCNVRKGAKLPEVFLLEIAA
jgi:5-methylcytosine-specific restriction endonuclease McrA